MPPQFFNGMMGFLGLSASAEGQEKESHAPRSEDEDVVVETPGASSGKRVRDEPHEQQSQASKKQRKYSREGVNYFGDYNDPVPKDAVKVVIPRNPQTDDDNVVMEPEQAPKVKMPAKPMGGAHKVKNTLGNPQAGRNGAGAVSKPFKLPTTTTTAKPTGKVLPQDQIYGDGFDETLAQGPNSKRRKTNGAPQPSTRNRPAVVIEDDSPGEIAMGEVREVNGGRVSTGSSRSDSHNSVIEVGSQSQPSKMAFFGASEFRNMQKNLDSRPHKKPRQHHGAPSSVLNGSNGQKRPSSGHTNQSDSIADLNTPSLRLSSTGASRPKADKAGKQPRPPINLGEGVDASFIMEEKEKRDINKMNGHVGRHFLGKDSSSKPRPVAQPVHSTADQEMVPRDSRQSTRSKVLQIEQSEEPSLRRAFKRDEAAKPQQEGQKTPLQRQTAVQRMQDSSTLGGSKLVGDSPDQLHGDNTLATNGHTNGLQAQAVRKTAERRSSPSDLRSTNFTNSNRQQGSTSKTKQRGKRASGDSDGDGTRIPMSAIYSRGCVLDETRGAEKELELVWHDEDRQFVVELDQKPYQIPFRDEHMSIGEPELREWHSCKTSLKAVLKGSMTPRSNGFIVLLFSDISSKNDCFQFFFTASNTGMKVFSEDVDRIGKLFSKQKAEVQQDAMQTAQKAQHSARALVDDEALKDRIPSGQPSDEIHRKAKARTRMEASSKQDASELTKSTYFQDDDHKATRKSSRQSKVVKEKPPSPEPPERWTHVNKPKRWQHAVMFPTTGPRKNTVDFDDLERLDEGEFLNDNLVGHALRRIEENMLPEHKSKVHFFNSFFFTALTLKNYRRGFYYDTVKKWTKQTDLFDVPYIVVPINENLHWTVAIICNLPNLARKSIALGDDTPDSAVTPSRSQQTSRGTSPILEPTVPDSQEIDVKERPDSRAMGDLTLSDAEKASKSGSDVFTFDDDGKIASSGQEPQEEKRQVKSKDAQKGKKSKKRGARSLPKIPTDTPIIITLDSFGYPHQLQIASLKEYVSAEAMEKRGMEVSRDSIKGMTATGVPLQTNYCDCGLYLVGYVAEFAKDPEGFVNKILNRELDEESDFASFDPSMKRAEIRDDLLRLHDEQDAERLAVKKAKKESKDKVPVTAATATPVQSLDPNATNAASRSPTTESQSHLKRSAQPLSSHGGPSPGASRPPSETPKLPHAPGPDTTSNARGEDDSSDDDTSDSDSDEMESGVPRALPAAKFEDRSRKVYSAEPGLANEPSKSGSASEDDGEMLDNPTNDEPELQDETIESRPNGMRKILSPELDILSNLQDIMVDKASSAVPAHAQSPHPAKKSS